MVDKQETIVYIHVGRVERWNAGKRSYVWKEAFSESKNHYPWMTRAECRLDAQKRGKKAKFRYPLEG